MPTAPRVALITTLLVAFALRAHHLTFESLWSDEGISLQRAAEPLRAMLAAMPVEHAPGYFVALRGWMALAGDSDFALRFFSLLGSVLKSGHKLPNGSLSDQQNKLPDPLTSQKSNLSALESKQLRLLGPALVQLRAKALSIPYICPY